MASNPIGAGTKTVGINMEAEMVDELIARAESMHLSVSKYCKVVLIRYLESGKKITLQEGVGVRW